MKNFFVRALGAAFCFTALINPLSAQNKNAGTTTAINGSGSLTQPVTSTITAPNDALKVNIADNSSIDYWFYSVDGTGATKLVQTNKDVKPTAPGSAVDLSLSAAGSASVMLVISAASDQDVVVSAVPDATTPSTSCTKVLESDNNYAVIDLLPGTNVKYELWVKKTPLDNDFAKQYAGTLSDDMVLGDPDAFEIRVVLTMPQGDGSATVSFSETKPQK